MMGLYEGKCGYPTRFDSDEDEVEDCSVCRTETLVEDLHENDDYQLVCEYCDNNHPNNKGK